MCEHFSAGDEYKNFEVIKTFYLSDYHSDCVHLRHKTLGIEIFHMRNDEEENVFSFNFRTADKNSDGAAHILEHSVLCGSEKFPLKDPFTHLSNQSVKTYLNAATYPDKTVYPASSTVKADYFNLMNVYADAVFFPRLTEQIFQQEAHRVQFDENQKPSFQGVVYNEMKGNYSSFESVAGFVPVKKLLAGSIYEKDSGGDPEEILNLSYEEFLNFYKTWYRPDNCLIFLYGNIPTAEQIDFLDENLFRRLEKKFPRAENAEHSVVELYRKSLLSHDFEKPAFVKEIGPSGDSEKKATVLLSWKFPHGKTAFESFELIFLSWILLNHDGSPLQKALVESSLGEDTAPGMGISPRYNPVFTVGLRGVKKENTQKVKNLVFDTLRSLVRNGINKNDVDAALMGLEFFHREIKRSQGPYALSLMGLPVNAWLYGDDVEKSFRLRSVLNQIAEKVNAQERYLENLIQTFLLDNKNCVLSEITPSKKFLRRREKTEKNRLKTAVKNLGIERIKAENERLAEFQSSKDDTECLPHLRRGDFIQNGKPVLPKYFIEASKIKAGVDSADYFESFEKTNGITYLKVGFPVDVVSAEDYSMLPLLSEVVCDCGWGELNWVKAAEETALATGGISASLLTNAVNSTPKSAAFVKEHDYCGRDWLVFNLKVIDERLDDGLKLLCDNINLVDFSDAKRIKDIAVECRNDLSASVIPSGHQFALLRALRSVSKSSAADELWNGISQVFALKRICGKDAKVTGEKLRALFEKIKNSGGFIHVTAEKETLEKSREKIFEFAERIHLKNVEPPLKSSPDDFIAQTELPSDDKKPRQSGGEFLLVPGQVGFAAEAIDSSDYFESGVFEVCAHWLSNILLWERVRTRGGAYGAFCDVDSLNKKMIFATYRDPVPHKSNQVFEEALSDAAQMDFSESDVEKAIMGTYSEYITPKTPRARGNSALISLLYALIHEDKEEKVLKMLRCSAADFKNGFKILSENSQKSKLCVTIGTDRRFADGSAVVLPV